MTKEGQAIEKYLRLKQVLEIIPVSRSTWYRGMKSGRYPRPDKLSERISGWRLSEIVALGAWLHNSPSQHHANPCNPCEVDSEGG